jgi:hypothetical protein
VGGNGDAMYTRPDHRVNSLEALRRRVAFCVTQTHAPWTPAEEADVVAYLNQRFYKFK